MRDESRPSLGLGLAALLIVAPAILFYAVLTRYLLDIPILDDYALLNFANHLHSLGGFGEKLAYLIAAQHNEYKLIFVHAVGWLELAALGHLELRLLEVIGNSFVLLLGVVLWKMFLPQCQDLRVRLTLFIPACWLLFELDYSETLDWAAPSLQNIPVLGFSLGAIFLLVSGSRSTFWGAVGLLLLAVAASGNGLLIIPIGLVMIGIGRKWTRAVVWIAASVACLWAYAFRYNLLASQTHAHQSIFSSLLHLKLLYVVLFMGAAGSWHYLAGGIITGFLLSACLGIMAWTGYFRRAPAVGYSALFVLLTAVGVAGIRSDFGVVQSMSWRYRIYSDLLLIFVWFAVAEWLLLRPRLVLWRNPVFLGALVVSVLFGLRMDYAGWSQYRVRNPQIVSGMALYEQTKGTASAQGPIPPQPDQDEHWDRLDEDARRIMREAEKNGVYTPHVDELRQSPR